MKKINKKWLYVLIILAITSTVMVVVKTIKPKTVLKCVHAGCSNQICVSSEAPVGITTCEWQDKFRCYQQAKCEVQSDGKCGFTQDEVLKKCLGNLIPKIIKLAN